jgi:hypothetical protein
MTAWLRPLLALCLTGLLLAGCSPNEADQRKAFIAFLQTEVLPKQGARVPKPDAEKQKPFGEYASHYAVITRFHERMDESVAKPMQEAMAKSMPRSIEEVVNRRDDIAAVRAGFVKMRDALEQAAAAAETERSALKQPEDLAAVYTAAYEKLVKQPVATFREIFPPTDDAFAAVTSMADLVAGNRATIKLNGSQLEVSDPALRSKVQAALTAMSDKQRAMNEAQQKLRRLVYGG